MKKIKLLLILAALGILFSCSNGSSESNYKEKPVTPAGTTVAQELEIYVPEVDVGDEDYVYVYFAPEGAKVSITCDTDLADFSGEVIKMKEEDTSAEWYYVPFKAKKAGTFTFKAVSGNKIDSQDVVIKPVLKSIIVSSPKTSIEVNESLQLKVATEPAGLTASISWGSSDTNIAKVDANGKVTAIKPGKVRIIAMAGNDSSGVKESGIVAGYYDLIVKGFYLSDTDFFLFEKDSDEIVTAYTEGFDNPTITWQSSDTNKFTVTGDGNKATLKYVQGASGDAILTATLTSTSGTATATATVYVEKSELLALGDSIAAGYAPVKIAKSITNDDTSLQEQDFIAAYNKYVNRRKNSGTNPDYVNEFAHSAVIGQNIGATKNIRVRSYAKTGDQTKHLLEKLQPGFEDPVLGTRKGEILEAVNEADYISLCIGANDILQHATGMTIAKNDAESFGKLLAVELEKFKVNFNVIVNTLTSKGQTLLVMSVYNPYEYFKEGVIPSSSINESAILGFITTKKFLELIPVAKNYLTQLNAYIETVAAANPNVVFVDVAKTFNNIAQNEHYKYVYVKPDMFKLSDLVMDWGRTVPVWFDPHPRKEGQKKIAELFVTAMK